MAALQKIAGKTGKTQWKINYYDREKKRKVIWIGEGSQKVAKEVLRHVEELLAAATNNSKPDPESTKWANNLKGRLRDTLAKHGLCSPNLARDKKEHRELGPFLEAYYATRTDWKPRTRDNYNQAKSWAVKHFGENKPLASITSADVGKWLRWMKEQGLSVATISKHGKRFRSCMKEAVSDRLIESNPAVGHKLGSEVNPKRAAFIDQKMSAAILEACPNIDWKLIFALPRYAGLRCPTEVLALRWEDLDWERNVMQIHSVKTGFREVPMFKPLDTLLLEALHLAPEGSQFVIQRYREGTTNLRTHLERIAKKAKVPPWEKTFVNLRSTCRTELQEHLPDKVLNTWLGHSSAVAERHYLQVTDEHLSKALTLDRSGGFQGATGGTVKGSTGGTVHADQELAATSNSDKSQGIRVVLLVRGSDGKLFRHPRQGLNNGPNSQGILRVDSLEVLREVLEENSAAQSFSDSSLLSQVLNVWDALPPETRSALVTLATATSNTKRGQHERQPQ